MSEWDQLLRWLHRDLRDERLRQASGHWIVLTALGLHPNRDPLPAGLALSTAMAPPLPPDGGGSALGLAPVQHAAALPVAALRR